VEILKDKDYINHITETMFDQTRKALKMPRDISVAFYRSAGLRRDEVMVTFADNDEMQTRVTQAMQGSQEERVHDALINARTSVRMTFGETTVETKLYVMSKPASAAFSGVDKESLEIALRQRVIIPRVLVGIPRANKTDHELKVIGDTVTKLTNGSVAVRVIETANPQEYADELIRYANAAYSARAEYPLLRILDAQTIDQEAIAVLVQSAMSSVRLDARELRNIMAFLKKGLNKITKVDIDKVLRDLMTRTLIHDPSMKYRYHPATTAMFSARKTMVSVTTQGVLENGLSLAVRIQRRWDMMGITKKEDDPCNETIIITDPNFRRENIEKYLEAQGLENYVDASNVIIANTDQNRSVDYVIQEVTSRMQTRGVPAITPDRIGIRSAEGELTYQGEPKSLLLQLQRDARSGRFFNINMYELLFDLFSTSGDLRPIPAGLEQKGKNLFFYLPRTVPINYQKEVDLYRRTIEHILSAA